MPMGIVSDDDFDLAIQQTKVVDIKRGRGEGRIAVPDMIREEAAKSAINGEGTGKDIARAFGISESSLSAYKVGATSTTTYNEPDDDLVKKILGHKERISKKAVRTALAALKEITPQKLEGVKARDLASIAKDMTSVIRDMEPKSDQPNQQNNVQFVFMAPRVKSIDEYPVINVAASDNG